jgi:hypothetical protein
VCGIEGFSGSFPPELLDRMSDRMGPSGAGRFRRLPCGTTAEDIITHTNAPLADSPRLMGSAFQRRMWLNKNFHRLPLRFTLIFLYHYLWQGAWRAGWVGYAWTRLRSDVMRILEYKLREIAITGRLPIKRFYGPGKPNHRVQQFECFFL